MDDFPEITPLEAPKERRVGASRGPTSALMRRLGRLARALAGDRRARLMATTLLCVVMLSLLLAQAIPDARDRALALLSRPTPTTGIQIQSSYTSGWFNSAPTPLLGASQTPVPPMIGTLPPPPANCPAAPPLASTTAQPFGFGVPVHLYGRSPIWLPEGMGYAPHGVIALGQPGVYDPYPSMSVLWEIGPTQYPSFTAQVSDVATGAPAWWETSGSSLQAAVMLTPVDPSVTPPIEGFFGWPMGLVFTHAGCYKLDVAWNGGEWYTIFAAGGASG
jgi:hypothetical protein